MPNEQLTTKSINWVKPQNKKWVRKVVKQVGVVQIYPCRVPPHCLVSEKIHTHSMEGHLKFLGGRVFLKVKILEAMYGVKLEIPGGMGDAKEKNLWGEYGYFLELHILYLRTVPTIVTAHTFCASRDTRVSYGWCLLIQGYFCAV